MSETQADFEVSSFKYKAFLSYSRQDRAFAVKLQRELESYVLPRALNISGAPSFQNRRPLKPVFRDESDLIAGADLPERIRAGLEQSEFLIVVCSPSANRSEWVEREIVYFISLYGRNRVLAVVAGGEPNAALKGLVTDLECLPPPLRYELDPTGKLTDARVEPYWIDRRKGSGDRRNMFLRIVGTLLSLDSLDELILRDRQVERRRHRITQGIALLGIVLASISTFMFSLGDQVRNNALISQSLFLTQESVSATTAGNARLGTLLALRALPADLGRPDRPYVAAAGAALSEALANLYEERTLSDDPSQPFNRVAYSPDGKTIAVVGDGGSVTLYDPSRGTVSDRFRVDVRASGSVAELIAVAYSPDGRQLVVGCSDQSVKILDVSTGRELNSFQYDENIMSVSFARDMSGVLIQSVHQLFWWHPTTSEIETITAVSHAEIVVSQSTDASVALLVDNDGLALWDLASKTRIRTYYTPLSAITGVYLSKDAKSFIVSSVSGIAIYDTATGAEKLNLPGAGYVSHALITKDAIVMVDIGNVNVPEPVIRVFDMYGSMVASLRPGDRSVSSIAISPDGEHLVTASYDGDLRLWSLKSRYQTESFSALAVSPGFGRFASGGDEPVTLQDVAPSSGSRPIELSPPITDVLANFSPDGQRIATWGLKDGIWLYDAQTGVKIADLPVEAPYRVEFSPDHRRLIALSHTDKDQAYLWDGDTGRLIADLSIQGRLCFGTFSPDGTKLIMTGVDPTVSLWDADNGDYLMDLAGDRNGVCFAQFSADNTRLATAGGDGTARIWDLSTGRVLKELSGHRKSVKLVALSPEGRQAATASKDLTVRLWDLQSDRTISVVTGYPGDVNTITYSRDGKQLAIAGQDGAVRVLNSTTGRLETTLLTGNAVTSVDFSPAGNAVFVVTGLVGHMIIWRLPPTCQPLVDEAKQIVNDRHFSLTEAEEQKAFASDPGTGTLSNIYAAIRPAVSWILPPAGDQCSAD